MDRSFLRFQAVNGRNAAVTEAEMLEKRADVLMEQARSTGSDEMVFKRHDTARVRSFPMAGPSLR
jgi:hypothetical protein